MRILVRYGQAVVELRGKSGKEMDRLTDLAVAIVNAMPDAESEHKREFGFQAGSTLETEIAVEG